jgi:hypothetical protein
MSEILTWNHPRFRDFAGEFTDRFMAEELQGNACQHDLRLARHTLETMGGVDVEASLSWFRTQGGYCDCEAGLNVIAPWSDT